MADVRTERLQKRFNAIRRALEAVHGKDKAFSATVAAWFMAIGYFAYEAHKGAEVGAISAEELKEELDKQLRSMHQEVCEHLGVDYKESIEIAASFHEVIVDICNEKG